MNAPSGPTCAWFSHCATGGSTALRREYTATGQALVGGLFAGALNAGIPIWTRTALTRFLLEDEKVTGAVLVQDGREVTVRTRRGVVLSTGGFDHDMAMRHEHQSQALEHWTMGAPGNDGSGIAAGIEAGAATDLMDPAW